MSDFWKDEPAIEKQLQSVRSLILATIERSNSFIRPLLFDRISTGGKMIRPALVIIGSALGTKEKKDEVQKIASVLEMVHLASLVHDDILDGAKTRRGIPTLYSVAGPRQAVLAGDYLLSKAMSLVEGEEGDLHASAVANAFGRLCESELDQDAGEGDFLISSSTYIRRIAGKTAALFALSAYSGAAVTGAPKHLQYRLHRIGYLLGIAFQIQDDILDYTGDKKTLGKEIGQDVRIGIPTYPLIAALQEEKRRGGERLYTLVKDKRRPTKKESRQIVSLAIEYGGVERAVSLVNTYIARAMDDIGKLGNSLVESQLISLYEKLSARRN
ncbi:MAG: polyprenyl synthetase family protein [Sphaerochaetaceae bacterium]|nr:polyprenyl synthetase family protein [Sphaerochaetaceae bacterium]MDC7247688.1 polyprenyl synthetase family protein [Sphaerochaetaceae bacterium]